MKEKSSKKNRNILIGIVSCVLVIGSVIFLWLKFGATKKYSVTFDSDGGTIVETIEVKEKAKIKKPKDPTKKDFAFDGWYYKNKLFDFDTKITKDITLKAHWSAGIGLKIKSLSLVLGSTQKIEISSLPEGLTEKDLIYSSSDDSIATVDKNGNLKALKNGTVIITIKSKDGKYSVTCKVTVTKEEVEIESVSINGSSSVTVGKSIKLSVTFKPDNATNQKITWSSSDNSIATVDENGNVKGLKAGTVTISVTTANGKVATKEITVKEKSSNSNNNTNNNVSSGNQQNGGVNNTPTPPAIIEPTSVSVTGGREINVGNSIQLSATVYPNNATNKSVSWRSGNSAIATVDGNGRVTGVSSGTVTITVTTSNGKTATIDITVKDVYVIYLTKRNLEVVGGAMQYDFVVQRNGKAFTDYLGFVYNGTSVEKNQGTISATAVANGGNTASLTLSSGQVVTATVRVN